MPSLVEKLRKTTAGQLRYGQARRIVQARRREIAEALGEGFAIKDIWRHLVQEEALTVEYRAFCKQVRKVFQGKKEVPAAVTLDDTPKDGAETANTSASPEDRTPLQVQDNPRPTFKWNPRPRKEDLI